MHAQHEHWKECCNRSGIYACTHIVKMLLDDETENELCVYGFRELCCTTPDGGGMVEEETC